MKRSRITIWVDQRVKADNPDPRNRAYEYVVTKAQNTTDVKIGEVLSESQVQRFADAEWTVNIK